MEMHQDAVFQLSLPPAESAILMVTIAIVRDNCQALICEKWLDIVESTIVMTLLI